MNRVGDIGNIIWTVVKVTSFYRPKWTQLVGDVGNIIRTVFVYPGTHLKLDRLGNTSHFKFLFITALMRDWTQDYVVSAGRQPRLLATSFPQLHWIVQFILKKQTNYTMFFGHIFKKGIRKHRDDVTMKTPALEETWIDRLKRFWVVWDSGTEECCQ